MAIHVDVLTRIHERDLRRDARHLERTYSDAGQRAGAGFGTGFGRGTEASMAKVQRSTDKVADALGRVRVEQEKVNAVTKSSTATDQQKIAAQERLASATRKHSAALREASKAHIDFERDSQAATLAMQSAAQAGEGFNETMEGVRTSMVRSGAVFRAFGTIGAPIGIIGLGAALVQVAGVAAAASQSIALLPGVIAGAAAAFGTLKIATLGFGDAVENVRDPEKFAEALRMLSPNAQQAAQSIRGLVPAFDQLKNATQDALFAGVGQQLNQLAAQFGPTIQQMTTGIAGAFNQMFQNVANQLMTPETQANVQTFVQNITTAFQQLAPAVAPLTAAFADLTAVGSSFLPDIASAASSAAQSFADFISAARASGELEQFMRDGLDAVSQLAGVLPEVVSAFFQLAPMGSKILPEIVSLLENINTLMPAIAAAALLLGPPLAMWNAEITRVSSQFEAIKGVVTGVANAVIPVINRIGQALSNAFAPLRELASRIGINIPEFNPISAVGGPSGDRSGRNRTTLPNGMPIMPGGPVAALPGSMPGGLGSGLGVTGANSGGWDAGGGFYANPGAAGGGGAGSTALPDAPVLPIDQGVLPPWAQSLPQTSSVMSAQSAFIDARHNQAEKQARLNQLEQSNVASENDLQKARNDKLEADQRVQQAEQRLRETAVSATEKYTDTLDSAASKLGEIGAQLDSDLGISEGLAGIAENLTKFLANLAAAPLLGQLGAISAMAPTQGGHGLMGILGAQGAFGPQYQNNQYASQSGMYGPSAMGPAALQPGMGVPMGGLGAPTEQQVKQIAAAFGLQVTSEDRPGDPGYHGKGMALDVSNGSGNTPEMRAFAEYMAQNFGSSLKELIYSEPGFKGLIGDGRNVTGTGYYDSGTLGDHENHVHIAAEWGSSGGGGGGGAPRGGGGASGLASSLFQDANGQWRSSLPGWDHLIQRESRGINQVQSPSTVDVNTGGNEAEGLFQITPKTWAANGGNRYAPSAITATPQEQADIAAAIFGRNPSGSDWGMGLAGRENPSQLRSELSGGGSLLPGTGMPQGLPFPQQGGGLPGLTAPVGVGSGMGQGLGPQPGVGSGARIGGVAPLQGTGQGGVGITQGGSIDTAMGVAASMFPGAGQAAQTGMKLANRAIQYGGQVAGIMTQGWMDTFLPMGGSKLAQSNWLTRIVGGLAGAAPALPNTAGSPGGQPSPEQVAGQPGAPGGAPPPPEQGGNTYNANITNNQPRDESGSGRDALYIWQNQGPGM